MDAMLIDVQRLDPDRLPGVDAVTSALLAAAENAESSFTTPPHDEIQAQAMADERRLFAANVQRWKRSATSAPTRSRIAACCRPMNHQRAGRSGVASAR
ncbi:hypothetical protein AB0J27_06725 [Micromonospora chokoriensis]